MKKLLLTALAATAISASANAQVGVGDVAPDFTLTDITGASYNLYSYLDSGYTVIIDVSAAWCGPCWAAHSSHVFENLMNDYGPNGTVNPKKIMVFFIEGESQNTTAQLYGPQGGSGAMYTQGDWITGSNYPFFDNPPASVLNAYLDGGFPTFTVIGRDRIVYESTAGYGSTMGATSWWMNIAGQAPTTGPSATIDAKPVIYTGANMYLCKAAPTFKFQNYSQSQTITNATINMYSGATLVGTQNWTGSLAPFATASVNMPIFTPTTSQNGPFTFEVVVPGDSEPSNNSGNTDITILTAGNSSATPYMENLDAANGYPAKMAATSGMFFFYDGIGNSPKIVGAGDQNTKAIVVDFFNSSAGTTAELFLGNFNTSMLTFPTFEFDVAYAQYSGSENDKLEVMASTDCGATWTTLYTEAGTALSTHAPVGGQAQFIPTDSSDWNHKKVYLSNYKDPNLMLKFKATSDFGNLGFLDNFIIKANATSVNDLVAENSINIYPNPAKDGATLVFDVVASSQVTVQVMDMVGRVVSTVAHENMNTGSHKLNINTSQLPAGIYNVVVKTDAGSHTERLTVIK